MARPSPFPPVDLDEALVIAKTIWAENGGKPMRRLTLFDVLKKSPESGASRSLITASSGYGLTEGGYTAESITLTARGHAIAATNDAQAKLDAVIGVPVFRQFLEEYRTAVVPSEKAALDFLKGCGLTEQSAGVSYRVLLRSGEQVALIQEISGTKRVVSPEHALEKLQQTSESLPSDTRSETQKPALPVQPSIPSLAQAPTQKDQLPTIHIDIQIHIAADAKPEQIDQIFASMAKHLYNRG